MIYIKVPKDEGINYIPKDQRLCERCVFFNICPYTWQCETADRNQRYYENVDNDDTENGDDEA